MMFLIRTAFWLAIIIMLLPTDEQQQRQIFGTAEATVRDLGSFCDRNPDVCARSSEVFDVFVKKAEFGVNMLVDFITDRPVETAAAAATQPAADSADWAATRPGHSQNTLTSSDLEPRWGGPEGSGI